jgi:O-antigen/teichoic acid export membrane protein
LNKSVTTLIHQHILWRGLYFFSILLINIGIARYFAAEKSGQIFYIVNNLALVILLVSISLESGAGYYIANGTMEAPAIARFCLIWAGVASMIAIAGWWAVLYITHSVYLTQTGFLLSSFLFILGVLLTSYFTALFYANKEFALPNKILLFANILLIGILLTGTNNRIMSGWFIRIYFAVYFLQGLLLSWFFFRKHSSAGKPLKPASTVLKKIFQYSIAALLANVMYFLVNRVDYWFVQHYCTASDLGNYIQASKLGQMLLILPSILGSTLFPIFSAKNKTGIIPDFFPVMRILFWINMILCSLILCSGWFVFPLVFGPSYYNMYLLFLLLVPGLLSFTLNYPLAAWFSAANRIQVNILGAVFAFIVICAGDFLLLPRYGIYLAPVISSAGYVSFYCFTVFMYRKENPITFKDFLIIRKSDMTRIRQFLTLKIGNPSSQDNILKSTV